MAKKSKNQFKSQLAKIPYPGLIFLALMLGLAPFSPPHLYEKIMMIANGAPMKPVDYFDILMHGSPFVLLGLRVWAGR